MTQQRNPALQAAQETIQAQHNEIVKLREFALSMVREKLLHGSNPTMLTHAMRLDLPEVRQLLDDAIKQETSPLQEAKQRVKQLEEDLNSAAEALRKVSAASKQNFEGKQEAKQRVSWLEVALKHTQEYYAQLYTEWETAERQGESFREELRLSIELLDTLKRLGHVTDNEACILIAQRIQAFADLALASKS